MLREVLHLQLKIPEGTVTFLYPVLLFGEVIKDLTLIVENGVVVNWKSTWTNSIKTII